MRVMKTFGDHITYILQVVWLISLLWAKLKRHLQTLRGRWALGRFGADAAVSRTVQVDCRQLGRRGCLAGDDHDVIFLIFFDELLEIILHFPVSFQRVLNRSVTF